MAKRKRGQSAARREAPKTGVTRAAAPAWAIGAPEGVTVGDTGFSQMRWDEKVVWVCLHLLLFLVPIAMGNITFLGIGGGMPISYDQFDIIKVVVMRALTIVAIAAWGAGMLLYGGRIRRTKIDYLILVFLAWVLVSSFFSIHPPTAIFGKYRRFEGWLSFVNYALVFFLVVQLADRASRARSLARTLVLSSMVVTWYGLMQYLDADFVQWGTLPFEKTRSFSTYGNPDLLGGFLVLALPVAAAMALSETSRMWRTIYWLATFMLSAVMITAFTRGAWIGGFVAVCILAFAVWRARIRPHAIDLGFLGLSVLAVVGIIVRSLRSPDPVLNFWTRLVSIFQFGEGSAATRFEIWKAALKAIEMRPVFGFGADTFRLVFPFTKTAPYVAMAGYLSVADNVHNYPLQLAAGIGIPGFLLLYGLMGYALYLGVPAAFDAGSGAKKLLQAGVWSAAVGYLVHLLFGLSVTGSTVILWVLLAIAVAPTARVTEVPAPGALAALRTGSVALVALAMLVLSVLNIQYLIADRYYMLGRIGPYDTDTRVAFVQQAIRLNPYNDMYRAELGLQYMNRLSVIASQVQQQRAQGADVTQSLQAMARDLALAERALLDTIEFVPPEYDNYVFLSNLYNLAAEFLNPSYFAKAEEWARKGVEVEHYGPAIRYQLARALVGQGKLDEAIKELKFASELDPNYAEAKMFYVTLLMDTGRKDEARQVLIKALEFNPEDTFARSTLESLGGTASTGPTRSAPTSP